MERKTAVDNFTKAERIELLLDQQGVPILPALSLDGRKIQEVDGEYFYLFDYFSGKAFQGCSFLICEPIVFPLERLAEDFQKFLHPIAAEPGKKPSIQQAVKGREQRIREEQAEKQ